MGCQSVPESEIDISVSKLLGFETSRFRNFCQIFEGFGFGFGKFGFGKKVSVSVSGKFGLGKEKIQITRTVLVMMSQIWDLVPIGTKALKWSHISPNSARKSQISSLWQDAKLPM